MWLGWAALLNCDTVIVSLPPPPPQATSTRELVHRLGPSTTTTMVMTQHLTSTHSQHTSTHKTNQLVSCTKPIYASKQSKYVFSRIISILYKNNFTIIARTLSDDIIMLYVMCGWRKSQCPPSVLYLYGS